MSSSLNHDLNAILNAPEFTEPMCHFSGGEATDFNGFFDAANREQNPAEASGTLVSALCVISAAENAFKHAPKRGDIIKARGGGWRVVKVLSDGHKLLAITVQRQARHG